MAENENDNSWHSWARHILAELERLDKNDTDIKDKIDTIKDELSKDIRKISEQVIILKVKVAAIAFSASLISSTVVTIIIELLLKK